jgi:hypothetical protein
MAALPLLTESNNIKVAITEADLLDYGALYFTYNGNNSIKALIPKFVKIQ